MSATLLAAEPCTAEDIGLNLTVTLEDDATDAERAEAEEARTRVLATVNEYLSRFAKPIRPEKDGGLMLGNLKCQCGASLAGFVGTFQWGLAHGEGSCTSCGYPGRGKHYIDLGEDGELSLPVILLYRDTGEEG